MAQRSLDETVEEYTTTRMATMDRLASVLEVAKRMAEQQISSIAIADSENRILGILTERDIVRAIARGVPADGITAGSLMSHPVVSVDRGTSVEDAARIMLQKSVRHLLVEDAVNGEIIGILSVTDLARYLKKNLADEELSASEVWELFF